MPTRTSIVVKRLQNNIRKAITKLNLYAQLHNTITEPTNITQALKNLILIKSTEEEYNLS